MTKTKKQTNKISQEENKQTNNKKKPHTHQNKKRMDFDRIWEGKGEEKKETNSRPIASLKFTNFLSQL